MFPSFTRLSIILQVCATHRNRVERSFVPCSNDLINQAQIILNRLWSIAYISNEGFKAVLNLGFISDLKFYFRSKIFDPNKKLIDSVKFKKKIWTKIFSDKSQIWILNIIIK